MLAWHLAGSENSGAWAALMAKTAPPRMVVSDGGTGFAKTTCAMLSGIRDKNPLPYENRGKACGLAPVKFPWWR